MSEKETLIIIDDWSVCRASKLSGDVTIYGEHHTNCKERKGKDHPHWEWEYEDRDVVCWICEAQTPNEIVGLIRLYNWDKI